MRLGDLADAVRQNVTATEVANMLGLNPDKAGFCKCPIHGEKTGSMKLYPGNRGWYCFGCHQGGSVIDLVMACNGVSLAETIQTLNDEFSLGLPIGYQPTKEQEAEARRRAEQREAERKAREARQKAQNAAFQRYCDVGQELAQLELDKAEFAPQTATEAWDERFVNALQKISELREEGDHLGMMCIGKEETD